MNAMQENGAEKDAGKRFRKVVMKKVKREGG